VLTLLTAGAALEPVLGLYIQDQLHGWSSVASGVRGFPLILCVLFVLVTIMVFTSKKYRCKDCGKTFS